MNRVEARFDEDFAPWGITLPPGTMEALGRGRIVQAGWAIWYLTARDERGTYLDYYAAHRMTSDSHVRIREDGSTESLPSIQGARLVSRDPEEDARLQAEYYARNREVARVLAEKGFGPAGDEPGGVLINRHLHTGG